MRNATDKCGFRNETEETAYRYATLNQGFVGSLQEWLSLDDDEREAYERGAAHGDPIPGDDDK